MRGQTMQITKLQATAWTVHWLAYVTAERQIDEDDETGNMYCEDTADELADTLTAILAADTGFEEIIRDTRYSNDEVNESVGDWNV